MTHEYAIADVFTDTPLQGNPVGVFLDAADLDSSTMQATARELNLAETVFVVERGGPTARIRIFTPTVELPFAGHPVLGTAFVLADGEEHPSVTLHTGAGPVPVALRHEGGLPVSGEMEQPLPVTEPPPDPEALLSALGVSRSVLPVEAYRNGPLHAYVALSTPVEVAALRPDVRALAELGPFGVSCFCFSEGEVKTRMFAPGLGVAEDPATGSAAGPLAVHLLRHGQIVSGRRLRIRQGDEIGRPSTIFAQADGDATRVERVLVGGSAVVVARGRYHLRP